MNPSRFHLPQHCSADRQRARRATIALERESYVFASDSAAGNPTPDFHLPPGIAGLPKAERFGPEKFVRMAAHKLFAQLQAPFVRISMSGSPMDNQVDYERVLGWASPISSRQRKPVWMNDLLVDQYHRVISLAMFLGSSFP